MILSTNIQLANFKQIKFMFLKKSTNITSIAIAHQEPWKFTTQ